MSAADNHGWPQPVPPKPIDMVLHCPACGIQHIDAPEVEGDEARRRWHSGKPMGWTNPPHRSHLCAGCGHIWRPADVPTNGVACVTTRGKNDSPIEKDRLRAWPFVIPSDIADAARHFVENGYRGPLVYARRVFDWVASNGARR